MVGNRRTTIDTIIATIFRYQLLFGLTTHVYDTRKHRLVHSRIAHCYSLSLHLTLVGLAPVFYIFSTDEEEFTLGSGFLFENLLNLIVILHFLCIFVCIFVQWAVRTNAPTVFNELIQIWHKDVAHLQGSRQIRRQSARLFIFKALTSVSFFVHAAYVARSAKDFYALLLSNVVFAVMFLFCSGLIFSQYMFQILNFNLVRVVEAIGGLCQSRYTLHNDLAALEQQLSDIGRVHARLQKCVVRFKDLYQVELMFIITKFLLLQVIILFVLCLIIRMGLVGPVLLDFVGVASAALWNALDLILLCYICGALLDASDEAGHIMRTLLVTEQGLSSVELERCFSVEKLRLRVCGLVDLDWSKGFAMSEAALLYIILLIQTDYEQLWK